MSGDVIKQFLVSLGFGVDDASLTRFNKSIASATLKVSALYGSISASATGIAFGISKISESFEDLGYEYKLIAPAINKALVLRQEMLKAYGAAGISLTKVVQGAVRLNISLTKTKYAFEAIYKSVASRFFDLITKQSDEFRRKIYANMPKIQEVLERAVRAIFKLFEGATELGVRLWGVLQNAYQLFVKLDEATSGWSTAILAVVAAWKFLNLGFLATPLGMIIGGLATILALFDDFEVWKEGGLSLFDWASFVPVIDAVGEALSTVKSIFIGMIVVSRDLFAILSALLNMDFSGAWNALGRLGNSIFGQFMRLWELIKNVSSSLLALGTWASGLSVVQKFFGNPNVTANLQGAGPNGIPLAPPLSSSVTNNSNRSFSPTLNQQTTINAPPNADIQALGKMISDDTRTNFNRAINMKGANSTLTTGAQ